MPNRDAGISIQAPVQVLSAPLLFRLPANGPGKEEEDSPSMWAPGTHVGDLDGAPGSWLQPGSVPAVVAIGE